MTDIPILECENVIKRFQDAKQELKVLSGVDCKIYRGEQIAIMGKSGSGKTTLLQMLGGLDAPSEGAVRFKGQDFHGIPDIERGRLRNRSLGFVYQFHHLLPEFTALENIAMPLLIGNYAVSNAEKRAHFLLDAVGLGPRAHHLPAKLSGGERQRVAIARALATQPDCILADEPTGNLDVENAHATFKLLKNLNQEFNITYVIVTHDRELAAMMNKIYHLAEGKLQLADDTS